MNLIPADTSEKNEILALYDMVRGRDYCVWNSEYPGMPEIDRDVSANCLYLLKDSDKIIGAVSIETEKELDDFSCWHVHENACEICRIVIHPSYHGKGLSKILIGNIIDLVKSRGYGAIHLSAAKTNLPANKLYKSLGFEIMGEAHIYGNDYNLQEYVI